MKRPNPDVTNTIELSIVMPCFNEAETLGACIEKARMGIERSGVRGEILVADNGSQDNSVQIAEECGARVVHVEEKRIRQRPARWHSRRGGKMDCHGRRRPEL